MSNKMKRYVSVLVASVMLFVASFSVAFAATSTVKMTVYDKVVKSGNTVYCIGAGCSICKVTLSNGKVKKVKWLRKDNYVFGAYSYNGSLKLKGNYLYYDSGSEGTVDTLCRINVKTGKGQALTNPGGGNYCGCGAYVIKNNKIYVSLISDESDKVYYRVMKLNGKSKKKTSVHPKNTYKNTNAKGYTVILKEKGSYVYTYLKTPKGTYKLGKAHLMDD